MINTNIGIANFCCSDTAWYTFNSFKHWISANDTAENFLKLDIPLLWSDVDLDYPSEDEFETDVDEFIYLDSEDSDSTDTLNFDGFTLESGTIVFHDEFRHSKNNHRQHNRTKDVQTNTTSSKEGILLKNVGPNIPTSENDVLLLDEPLFEIVFPQGSSSGDAIQPPERERHRNSNKRRTRRKADLKLRLPLPVVKVASSQKNPYSNSSAARISGAGRSFRTNANKKVTFNGKSVGRRRKAFTGPAIHKIVKPTNRLQRDEEQATGNEIIIPGENSAR